MSKRGRRLNAAAEVVRSARQAQLDASLRAAECDRHLREVERQVLIAAAALRRRDRAVAGARTEGASWAQIGRALGVSPQAAHRKFAAGDTP